MKKPSFWVAMGAYAALAVMVALTLDGPSLFEARLRGLVWLLLAALAVRTWIHKKREQDVDDSTLAREPECEAEKDSR